MVVDGVNEYQTECAFPTQSGSSDAVVACVVSSASLNGRLEIAVALSKSSFPGGAASACCSTRPVIPRPTSRANTSLIERRRGGMCFPPLLAGVDPYEQVHPPATGSLEGRH